MVHVSVNLSRPAWAVTLRLIPVRGAKNVSRSATRSEGTGGSGRGRCWTASESRMAGSISVSPVRQLGRRIGRVEDAIGDHDALLHRLSPGELLDRVEGLGPEQRAALDRAGELALDDRLEGRARGVDRDHEHVLARRGPGGLDRLDRAERNVVVVGVDRVDPVLPRLEDRLHDLLALGQLELAVEAHHDPDARLLRDALVEALLAVDRRIGPRS